MGLPKSLSESTCQTLLKVHTFAVLYQVCGWAGMDWNEDQLACKRSESSQQDSKRMQFHRLDVREHLMKIVITRHPFRKIYTV